MYLGLLCLSLILSPISNAGISDDMDSFFTGTANVSEPGVSQSQMGGLYTAGSVSVRTPIKNTAPFKISMPSYEGGCNGIDMFAGAFSMINSDQLIALGKAIASNAAPFAFDLAVQTLSPSIHNAYEKLRRLAQTINQMQINSCEQAASLVANVWPFEADKNVQRSVCQTLGRRRGFFSDSAAAKYSCDNKGQGPAIAGQARNDPEFKDVFKDNTNSTWSALSKSGLFSDNKMKRIIMTLVGTVVKTAVTTESGKPTFAFFPPELSKEKYMNAFLYGDTIQIHSCNNTTTCLSVGKLTDTATINEEAGFVNQVKKMISEMEVIARSKTETLKPEHINFLNRTTLPIYKMILVDAAYGKGSASAANPDSYAEAVALDYFYNYINSIIEAAYAAVAQDYAQSEEGSMKQWISDLRNAQRAIQAKVRNSKESISVHTEMMQRTMQLEKMISSDLTNQVVTAFDFTNNL
jgi:conjugative transfer pilus assembly protein TraH